MTLVSKAFSDIVTFSRSSNATRIGPNGLVQYAPHNLVVRSEEFDNASWPKFIVTVSANVIAAPNGTVTADKLVLSSSTAQKRLGIPSATYGAATYTFSCYAKAGEYGFLMLVGFDTVYKGAVFNLNTGAIGTTDSATASITSVGNGWYRCAVTFTATTSLNVNASGLWPYSADPGSVQGVGTSAGDGTSGIYIWGAQLSVGPLALDYTPTTTAAVYGPRFDYDPVTLAARGLLIEEQRTNIVTYSEQFDNAYWISGGTATVTANATTAPDGTVTADLVIPTAASAFHRLSSPDLGQTTVSYSVFVKAGGYSKVALRENATQGSYISVNLNTGTIIESANVGTGTVSGATITSFGNGWYRISGYFVTPVNSAWGLVVLPDSYTSGNVNTAWTGNGTSGVYVWGAQAEVASFASSYIPTLASTVTRSADVASVNTLSPWFNATEGTILTEFDFPYPASTVSGYPSIVSINDGTTNNEMTSYIQPTSSHSGRFYIVSGGVNQADLDTTTSLVSNTTYKLAATYKANDIAASILGQTPVTDSSASIPTVSAMQIGLGRVTSQYSGHIRRLAYYPRRLTNAELQALTA